MLQVNKTIERPKDDVTWEVMEDLTARAKRGLDKYNTTLANNNHQNMLQHAYEEALDLAQYLKKEITTLNTVQDLVKKHPNLELLREPELSIVAFTRKGWEKSDYQKWSDKLLADQIGFIPPSSHDGKPILRFAIVNPWTKISDIEMILSTL